jgi:hypothetical protein
LPFAIHATISDGQQSDIEQVTVCSFGLVVHGANRTVESYR